MKSSKQALKTSAQEECGVWLDTTQLKGRAKQKLHARPISKLLNPFAGGEGYNVAVALNFTQTKLEMPKTKQSSISTFFAAQRRVLNKMSTSEVPNMDPVLPSSSSTSTTCASTASTLVASGTKQRRELDPEPGVDHDWKSENMTEPETDLWKVEAERQTPSQNLFCELEEEEFEEISPPQRKRRLTATSLLPGDSQPPPLAWSQDPLFTYSQYTEGEFNTTEHKNTTEKDFSDSDSGFFSSLQSEEAFGIRMHVEARTSTQKSLEHVHTHKLDDEKENNRFLPSKSPSKHSALSHVEPFSNHKWTQPKTPSPRKHIPVHPWKEANKEDRHDSQFKRTKLSRSPLKKIAPQQSFSTADEDSLAVLFTQDSEGFRVIAHRGLQARSPLKDQSNINTSTVRTGVYKSLAEEDEEDEMLFTQDSQGNLVIKH